MQNWSVQLIVTAPEGTSIDVETSNGPIGVSGFSGTLSARASNGPISLTDVSGGVKARASNGPISVTGSSGEFDIETANGPIDVRLAGRRWDGHLDAHASNGPLSVRVPADYQSGVEISSSYHSPWSCRAAACRSGNRDWDDRITQPPPRRRSRRRPSLDGQRAGHRVGEVSRPKLKPGPEGPGPRVDCTVSVGAVYHLGTQGLRRSRKRSGFHGRAYCSRRSVPMFPQRSAPARIPLISVISGLSHALDLTEGHPYGHANRSCIIGMRIAQELGLPAEQQTHLHHALLLKDAGCSSNASASTSCSAATIMK